MLAQSDKEIYPHSKSAFWVVKRKNLTVGNTEQLGENIFFNSKKSESIYIYIEIISMTFDTVETNRFFSKSVHYFFLLNIILAGLKTYFYQQHK